MSGLRSSTQLEEIDAELERFADYGDDEGLQADRETARNRKKELFAEVSTSAYLYSIQQQVSLG